jgi:hypothetical protein
MHDHSAQMEVLRRRREELLEEAEKARLAREARRGRRVAGGEWRVSLGGWVLRLRRVPEYGARPAAKG